MEAAGKEIYTDSFYRFMKHKENSCKKAAEAIYQLLCPTSVVDIGCGTGEWLAHFKKCGASVVRGYDGSYVAKEMLAIAQEEFLPCNLSENIQVDRKYDLAVSLEVAEHLDACCADQLVANITGFSMLYCLVQQFRDREGMAMSMNNGRAIGRQNLKDTDMSALIAYGICSGK